MKGKKFLGFLLAALLMAASAVTVYASDARVLLDGVFLDVEARIVDSRTLLPLRAVAEAVGADVDWDGDTRQVTLTHGATTILLTIDNTTAYVNGAAVVLDVPAQIFDGRTFLPVRFVGESLGLYVSWGYDTAILRSPGSAFTEIELVEMARSGVAAAPTD